MAYYSGGGGNPPPRRPPPYPLRDTWMRSPPDWPNNSAPSQLAPHPRTPDPDSEIYENIYDSRWRLLNQVRKGQKNSRNLSFLSPRRHLSTKMSKVSSTNNSTFHYSFCPKNLMNVFLQKMVGSLAFNFRERKKNSRAHLLGVVA